MSRRQDYFFDYFLWLQGGPILHSNVSSNTNMGATLTKNASTPSDQPTVLLQNSLLAEELLVKIGSYLTVKDLDRQRGLCKHSHTLCTQILKERFQSIKSSMGCVHIRDCLYRDEIFAVARQEKRQPVIQDIANYCKCPIMHSCWHTPHKWEILSTGQLVLLDRWLCRCCQRIMPDSIVHRPKGMCVSCRRSGANQLVDCEVAWLQFEIPKTVYAALPGCVKNRPMVSEKTRRKRARQSELPFQAPLYYGANRRETTAAYEGVTMEVIEEITHHIYGYYSPVENLAVPERLSIRTAYLDKLEAVRTQLRQLMDNCECRATPNEMMMMRQRALCCKNAEEVIHESADLRRYLAIFRLSQLIREVASEDNARQVSLFNDLHCLVGRKKKKRRQHL